MNIAFTGHRPHKLGGYNDSTNLYVPFCRKMAILLNTILDLDNNPEFITGMALGVDTWVAQFAINHSIPFHAYIPFKGQETMWPLESQKQYRELLLKAKSVTYVCPDGYAAWKMQKRNEAMVRNCDILIAVWDGSTGGTANCVRYANSVGKKMIHIKPSELA